MSAREGGADALVEKRMRSTEVRFALVQRFIVPASQQLVEIVAPAGDGVGIIGRPAIGETARRRTRPW